MEPCRKTCQDFDAHTCSILVDCHASIIKTLCVLRELQVEMMANRDEVSNWDEDGSEYDPGTKPN